jgi:hypothetical protein
MLAPDFTEPAFDFKAFRGQFLFGDNNAQPVGKILETLIYLLRLHGTKLLSERKVRSDNILIKFNIPMSE